MEPDKIEKEGLNVKDILLPQKEGRTSASAERTSAGVLLESEQSATLPVQPAPAPIQKPAAPQGPTNSAPIASLQTYQGDVDSVITSQNISAVSIVAAEAARAGRGGGGGNPFEQKLRNNWVQIQKIGLLVAGIALVLLSVGGLGYVFLRPTPSLPAQISAQAPFIAVDDTQILLLNPEQLKRATVIQNLLAIKEKTAVSLGLMARTYVVVSTTTIENEVPPAVSAASLLETIAPNVPEGLTRTLDSSYYLLGTHVYDGNQPFFIFRTDSYEQAFAGMLEWERSMSQDLAPLFTRTPTPRINGSSASIIPASGFLPTAFRDKIIENHDARAIINDQGDILLLWAFLDRDTLVITTNEFTLREIISRRSTFTSGK